MQGRVQDLKKGGVRAHTKKLATPRTLTMPLINTFENEKEGCFTPNIDEELLSKF
jgi:hypothetical protein